ncbi:hypothetical protein [Leuconostoc lactis]|uniref:hypothetical protein n=1 Tax=Leuconostoc lactis TaxID=1246 RepID=UPI0024ACF5C1|nr:hypothetical protein [Leuconostoc lactis]MDI6574128.1 hypothetical protein [Leuconostoc lactis]
METKNKKAIVTTVTTTVKIDNVKMAQALASELFEVLYASDQFEKSVNKIQSKLNRWKESDGYHDHKDTQNLLMSALYDRLSRAKVSTLQQYSNSITEQNRLVSLVAKAVVDNENNDSKIYTLDRELVTSDEGVTTVKQVRNYKPQVSFDVEVESDDGSLFGIKDTISLSDIRIPDMREGSKGNVVQVLKHIYLFSKPSQGFVMMLFTEGSSRTRELLGMTTGNFNQKIQRLEDWISKHEAFKDILTGQEQQHIDDLSDMAHFEIMLNMAERSQVQRWLVDNQDKPWVEILLSDYVDNDSLVIDEWDIEGARKNSYMFMDGMRELDALYRSEVSR